MGCIDIVKQLNAWMDKELSYSDSMAVERHIEQCASCGKKAAVLKQICRAMDRLEPIKAPEGFLSRVRQAVRPEVPDLALWWRHLSFGWRSAVCGAVMAGLVCGAGLGTSMAAFQEAKTTPYHTMYSTGGIIHELGF